MGVGAGVTSENHAGGGNKCSDIVLITYGNFIFSAYVIFLCF